MNEIRELTDTLKKGLEKGLPVLEAFVSAFAGSQIKFPSPRNMISHAADYLRTLKDKTIYHSYQTAIVLGYTFK